MDCHTFGSKSAGGLSLMLQANHGAVHIIAWGHGMLAVMSTVHHPTGWSSHHIDHITPRQRLTLIGEPHLPCIPTTATPPCTLSRMPPCVLLSFLISLLTTACRGVWGRPPQGTVGGALAHQGQL